MPFVQCRIAASFIQVLQMHLFVANDDVDVVSQRRRQWSATERRQFTSGGK